MKEGKITDKGIITGEGATHLPGSDMARLWIKFHLEGKASLVPQGNAACLMLASIEERHWRDGELLRADIELSKVQDGRGDGLVSDWRQYRNMLRDWPEHKDFPSSSSRPQFVSLEYKND